MIDEDKALMRDNLVGFILGFVNSHKTCPECDPNGEASIVSNDEIREIFRVLSQISDEDLDKMRASFEHQLRFYTKNEERVRAAASALGGLVEDAVRSPKLHLVE